MRRKKQRRADQIQALINAQTEAINKQILAQQGLSAYRKAKGQLPEDMYTPPPVFSECVVGYRIWKIDPLGRLRPLSVDKRPWLPGENTAVCDAHANGGFLVYSGYGWDSAPPKPNHKAPAKDCECGLYSRFDPSEIHPAPLPYHADAAEVYVAGSVAGWGDIQVHADGMRAEKACVTALAVTDGMPANVRELVERVAAVYRVPAVPWDALATEALLHGMPLPHEHRPEKPETPGWASYITGNYVTSPIYVQPGSYIQVNTSGTNGP